MEQKSRKKDSFLLYASQYEAIRDLSEEQMGKLFHALFRSLNGQETTPPDLDPQLKIAYGFLQLQIRKDKEIYEMRLEADRIRKQEYRKRKKEETSAASEKSAHDNDNDNENDNENDNDNDNVNENDNENENVNENENDNVNENDNDHDQGVDAEKTVKADSMEKEAENTRNLSEEQLSNFLSYFNRCARNTRIPTTEYLTDRRRQLIRNLARQFTDEQIVRAMRNAALSPFLNGRNKHNFVCTFDWLLQPDNFVKVLENNYRQR